MLPQQIFYAPDQPFRLFDLDAETNVFTPSADSTSVLTVTNAANTTDVFRVDTTNKAVFVGGAVASDSDLYDPNINFYVSADSNNYAGINVWNINSGDMATCVIGAINDSAEGFVSLEMTGTNNADPAFEIMNGGRGACYSYDSTMVVGAGAGAELILFAGGFATANTGATLASDGTGWTFSQPVDLDGEITGDYVFDEDNMASDSAVGVPTQQSVKAYVDTKVGDYLPLAGGIMTGDITIDSDSKKVIFGAGQDMTIWYDGTDGQIKTDDIAASDLVISCGANKTIELTNPVYDDIRVTPGSFDRPGSSDPTIKQVTPGGSGTNTWLYEFAVNNIASFTVQMPHNYKTGEDIKVHIHWTPGDRGSEENTATVGWKIDYTWANINGAFGSMSTADLSDACNGVDWEHNMTPDVTIDGHTAAKGISSMLICNVKRTDTGTDDTWASTTSGQLPLLLEIDFHYPITRLGSRNWGTE